MSALLTSLALLFEAMLGYPERVSRAIGHPVMWMGALIGALDRLLNRKGAAPWQRKGAGALALSILILVAGGLSLLVEHGLLLLPLGVIALAIVASTLIAQRSLHAHVERVALALEEDGLERARETVTEIVGRDTATLDEAGAAVYKAINTADSMIGHRTKRHQDFGWASARLDDLVNLPASRLAALLIAAAAYVTPSSSAGNAIGAVMRDASRHKSPNAGYPEAAMAGALGLALAGPRYYGGKLVEDVWMGDGRYAAEANDIRAA